MFLTRQWSVEIYFYFNKASQFKPNFIHVDVIASVAVLKLDIGLDIGVVQKM